MVTNLFGTFPIGKTPENLAIVQAPTKTAQMIRRKPSVGEYLLCACGGVFCVLQAIFLAVAAAYTSGYIKALSATATILLILDLLISTLLLFIYTSSFSLVLLRCTFVCLEVIACGFAACTWLWLLLHSGEKNMTRVAGIWTATFSATGIALLLVCSIVQAVYTMRLFSLRREGATKQFNTGLGINPNFNLDTIPTPDLAAVTSYNSDRDHNKRGPFPRFSFIGGVLHSTSSKQPLRREVSLEAEGAMNFDNWETGSIAWVQLEHTDRESSATPVDENRGGFYPSPGRF